MIRRMLRAGGLVAIAALVASCGFFFDPPGPAAADCGWMTDGSVVTAGAPARVVLLDRSDSTRADPARSADESAPNYIGGLDPLIQSMVAAGAVVSVGTFDGTAASVRWAGQPMATNRGRVNDKNQEADRAVAQRCLSTALQQAGADGPTQAGTDVVGAVKLAVERLGSSGDREIVIATDGLATVGCADLTHASIGDARAIGQIVRLCEARKDLPVGLADIGIHMIGIGHPASGRPQPATSQLFWLQRLWSSMLCPDPAPPAVRAAECTVSVDSVVAAAPGTRVVASEVTDPDIAFPPPPSGVTRIPVDSRILFNRNSDVITPGGRAALQRIANDLRGAGMTTVTVEGYTEAQSTPEDNLGLATRRANAVGAVLVSDQIAATPHGHAEAAPGCGGSSSEGDRQCRRRVDIVAEPAPQGS